MIFLAASASARSRWCRSRAATSSPAVDTGEIRLHLRAPTGTRIEETARLADQVEAKIRTVIPKSERGVAARQHRRAGERHQPDLRFVVGADRLGRCRHHDRAQARITRRPRQYVAKLRNVLAASFPGVTFAFLPADIVSQILNFGLPAPIDIQIVGNKLDANRVVAERSARATARRARPRRCAHPAARRRARDQRQRRPHQGDAGRPARRRDVAQNLLIALSGSSQTTPNFWLDPKNGVSYPLMAKMPQYDIHSLQTLANLPLDDSDAASAARRRTCSASLGTHDARHAAGGGLALQRAAGARYLRVGARARPRRRRGRRDAARRPEPRRSCRRGSSIVMRGQVQSMHESFSGLGFGLVFAIALVYLLMVVNFQSWLDPLIIVSGLPASLAGIAWMLFAPAPR